MISKDEMIKLTKFSRLEFSEKELPKLIKDLENIMEFTSKVSEYKCDDNCDECKIKSHSQNVTPVYPHCTQNELLSGGIGKNGFFFVKKY